MTMAPTDSGSPLVTVIVATYNRPDALAACLRTILCQTYPHIEIALVNDAGPEVRGIVDSLNDKGNITYIRHPSNRGIAAARNTGIAAANGKYLAYLDDDDGYYPDHLERLVDALEHTEFKVAYTDAARRRHRNIDGRDMATTRDVPHSSDFDRDHLLVRNFIPTLCILHEKSCLDDAGRFDETLPVLEDWDLWIRLSKRYPFLHLRNVTCEFAWNPGGGTLTSDRRTLFRRTVEEIYARTERCVRDKPHVRRARRHYVRGMRFLSFLSGLLGERSASFQLIQDALTAAYRWGNRFRSP